MGLRSWATMAAAIAMFGALSLFEGVARTDAAMTLARAALINPELRSDLLARAEGLISGSWSGVRAWHGGAAETASWIASLRAVEGAPDAGPRAARAGERAVGLAPVQPITWMRLAALGKAGEDIRTCAPAQCLERSWASAAVIEPEPGCARIQVSVAEGLMPDNDDARFGAYVSTLRDRRHAVDCFGALPPQRSFQQLLRLQTPDR